MPPTHILILRGGKAAHALVRHDLTYCGLWLSGRKKLYEYNHPTLQATCRSCIREINKRKEVSDGPKKDRVLLS